MHDGAACGLAVVVRVYQALGAVPSQNNLEEKLGSTPCMLGGQHYLRYK